MNKIWFIPLLFLSACASKSREPAMVVPAGALELEQALKQGPEVTVSQLKSQLKQTPFQGSDAKTLLNHLPPTLKAEKNSATAMQAKTERQQFIRKFKPWSLIRKSARAQQLLSDFNCEKAIESQALALTLEINFPHEEAMSVSKNLHEKSLTCEQISKNDSLFRLAIFAIQKGDCGTAQTYLKAFPSSPEQGVNDRISFLRGLCSPAIEVSNRNPWGGYGILLHEENASDKSKNSVPWYLSTASGSEEWDRLLATYVDLLEKGHPETVKYLSSKLNFEKFRSLPLPFQTSMLVLMSFSGADLTVFQNLHRYLAEHPAMISPTVAGLLFPVRFWKEISENSKGADPVLVKSLIRQESAFDPKARSRAKAAGLMQLIFPTARIFGVHKPKELLVPETNIQAGSEFLAKLIQEFGSVELALAAYNAGPEMVRQWKKRYPTDNIELFVEMIPYSETREYVRLVTRNYKVYQSILIKPHVVGDSR